MLSGGPSIWTNFRFQIIAIASVALLALAYISKQGHDFNNRKPLGFQSLDSFKIPKTIWHIFLHKRDIPSDLHPAIHSWAYLNPQHSYNLVETVQATDILFDLYPSHPEVVHTFQRLESTVMRADFLRYVLLAAYGGVYTDVDTMALEPVDNWIPEPYRNFTRVVIGIEYDQRNDTARHITMPHSLSLCQWTIASTANHPLMWSVVDEVMWTVQERADSYGTDIEHLRPTDKEVIMTTGPGLWTVAIIKYLRSQGHSNLTYSDFSGLKEPKLIDDVLIMPINAFGSGQGHSGATKLEYEKGEEGKMIEKKVKGALVRHLFSMSWRHGCSGVQNDGSPCF